MTICDAAAEHVDLVCWTTDQGFRNVLVNQKISWSRQNAIGFPIRMRREDEDGEA